ncbi:hypothetical protein WNY37_06985 [Henriciella sp. AS95]|uniref:hypothetical protein n=1 Tax=Henriciella sp. AS95 TaxID=3135782 RepID=UPI00317EE2DD
MNGTYFETFMVGGLALMVAAALSIAWLLWRQDDVRREAVGLALEGIGHEFRFNMFQMVREINDVEDGMIRLPVDLPTLAHPQLDAVLGEMIATDKRALAAIQATYQILEARKRRVRMQLADGAVDDEEMTALKAATVQGISTLYLWEDHEGAPPEKARSTRSWWVRDWMKAHGFTQDLLSGLALRDAVVEDLRQNGMELTPQPLTLTAHEYYSRQYDRHADPRGVFGTRRLEESEAEEAALAEEDAVMVSADEVEETEETPVVEAAAIAPAAAAAAAVSELADEDDMDEAEEIEPVSYEPDIDVKADTSDEGSADADAETEDDDADPVEDPADETDFSDDAEVDPAFADADADANANADADDAVEDDEDASDEEAPVEEAVSTPEPDAPVDAEIEAAAAVPSGQPADDPFAVLNAADLSAFEPDPETGKLDDTVPGEDDEDEDKPRKSADAAE